MNVKRLTLPLISTALLLAACGGGSPTPPQPQPAPVRTPTLYQGVWGWAAVNTSGDLVARGALILSEQVIESGRSIAVGIYTNESQTQTGLTILGPITAIGKLETAFSYDLSTTDNSIYLAATDTDGQFENYQGSATFLGEGAIVNRITQEPSQPVEVILIQASTEVPTSQSAKIQAQSAARNLAVDAVKRQLASNRAMKLNLAPSSQNFNLLRSAAANLLNNR